MLQKQSEGEGKCECANWRSLEIIKKKGKKKLRNHSGVRLRMKRKDLTQHHLLDDLAESGL